RWHHDSLSACPGLPLELLHQLQRIAFLQVHRNENLGTVARAAHHRIDRSIWAMKPHAQPVDRIAAAAIVLDCFPSGGTKVEVPSIGLRSELQLTGKERTILFEHRS